MPTYRIEFSCEESEVESVLSGMVLDGFHKSLKEVDVGLESNLLQQAKYAALGLRWALTELCVDLADKSINAVETLNDLDTAILAIDPAWELVSV